jgi:hypothetical protein
MKLRLVVPLIALMLLVSCSKQEEVAADAASVESSTAPASVSVDLSKQLAPSDDSAPLSTDALTSSALTQTAVERRFVITSSLEFRVKRVQDSALKVEDLAAKHGGFVVDNTITSDTGRVERNERSDGSVLVLSEYITRGSLIVRVPSANTQAFIRELAPFVEFLDKRQFSAQDVHLELLTQQLLANRSAATQGKLNDLVDQPGKINQKAQIIEKLADAGSGRDQAELNRLLLEDKIGFSTIALAIYQNPDISRNVVNDFDAVRRDNRSDFLPSLWSSLKSGWFGLISFVLGMLSVWPLLLVLGLVLVWIRSRKRIA